MESAESSKNGTPPNIPDICRGGLPPLPPGGRSVSVAIGACRLPNPSYIWHIYGILFCGIDASSPGSALREMTVWFIVDVANLRDVYMFLLFASGGRPVL